MTLTLLLLLGLLSFRFFTTGLVTTIEEKVDISAYFKVETSEEQILSVKSDLEKLPEIVKVTYISRAQALEEFKERHKKNPEIIESFELLDDNPLKAALNIRAQDSSQYAVVAGFLEGTKYKPAIADVSYNENQEVIDKIHSFSSALGTWGLAVTIIVAAVAIMVTFNTIQLTIYNQRQEIEIMRLVGASNWQIRGPYLAEGAYYGILAAIIASVIFYPVIYMISQKLLIFIPDLSLFDYMADYSLSIIGVMLGAGIIIGVISSVIAIKRHLYI